MHELPSAVRVAEVWRTQRPARAALTITTGLSYDRLDLLLSMCRAWPGPISAVVHLPLVAEPPKLAGSGRTRLPRTRARSLHAAPAVGTGASRTLALATERWYLAALAAAAAAAAAGRAGPYNGTAGTDDDWRAVRSALDPAVAKAVVNAGLFHRTLDSAAGAPCQLDMMLVYEYYDTALSKALYPYNIMRNYARLQARTPLVAMLDIDMLPSRQLFESLASNQLLTELQTYAQSRHVVVLPAFKTSAGLILWSMRHLHPGQIVADVVAQGTKAQLAAYMAEDLVWKFDGGNMDYERWFGEEGFYWIHYPTASVDPKDPAITFEPWAITSRTLPPFADVRFRGYGMDKLTTMANLRATGFTYVVHPHAFIIHRPHHASSAAGMYTAGRKASAAYLEAVRKYEAKESTSVPRSAEFLTDQEMQVYVHAQRLGRLVMGALASGNYSVVLDRATVACQQLLPWWRGTSDEVAEAASRRRRAGERRRRRQHHQHR